MADIQIVSNIMTLLGRQPITSIQDDDWGPIIDAQVDQVFVILLEVHNWQFALKHVQLTRSTTNSNPDYAFEYPLPADFLTLDEVYQSFLDGSVVKSGELIFYKDYSVEGDSLFSDRSPLVITYVSNDITLASRSKVFQQALSYFVAAQLAPVLLGNFDKAEGYLQYYQRFLEQARAVDYKSLGRPQRWRQIRRSL